MNALVKAQNLSYKINDKKLFQGISFELLKGKALHIQGENGSGKTTLLRMVCGLTKPTNCLLYTSPSPRDRQKSRMPSSA